MVTGLNGSVKLHNGADTITVSANGSFAFPTPVGNNQTYAVTVTQQPAYPPSSQTCVVTQGTGTVRRQRRDGHGRVHDEQVHRRRQRSGLTGTLVLRDNGGDDKTITANGAFTFATPVFSGLTYAVTVRASPRT